MAGYFIQQDWTERPPSGTPLRRDGHGLVQGMVGCWAFNEGGGSTVFEGIRQTASITTGAVTIEASGLKTTTRGANKVAAVVSTSFNRQSFTIITSFLWDGTTGSQDVWSASGTTSGAIRRFNTGSKLQFEVGATLINSNTALVANKWYVGAAVADSSSASTKQQLFLDGILESIGNGLITSSVQTQSNFFGVSNISLSGQIGWSLLYNRALSPAEIASLSANPWQVFEPRTIWVEVGGGGLSSVTSDFSTVFDLRQIVTGDFSAKWDILNTVTSDFGVSFDLLNSVFATLGVVWDIRQEVNGDFSIVFDTRNLVQSDLQVVWDMAGTVFSDFNVRFDIGNVSASIRIIGSSFRRIIQ